MTTDPKTPELRAWTAFPNAQASLLRRLEAELIESEDMTLAKFDVLIQLAMAPDRRLRMTELSDRVRLSHSGVTRLVDRLTQAGLVKRARCDSDRRGTFATLTAAGRARRRRAQPLQRRRMREPFAMRLASAQAAAARAPRGPLGRQ